MTDVLELSIGLDPLDVDGYYARALAYTFLGEDGLAEQDVSQVKELEGEWLFLGNQIYDIKLRR